MDSIGERIRKIRDVYKLTQIDIYNRAGISSGNLSDLENNKSLPSTKALLSLNREFGVSIDWILTGKGLGPGEEPKYISWVPDSSYEHITEGSSETVYSIDLSTPGQRFKLFRKNKGLSIVQMAHEMDIDQDYIEALEDEESLPTDIFLDRLQKIYNADPEWIDTGKLPANTGESPPMLSNSTASSDDPIIEMYKALPEDDREEIGALVRMKFGRLKGLIKKRSRQISGHDEEAAVVEGSGKKIG